MRRRGYQIRQAYPNANENDVSSNPSIGSPGSNSPSSLSTNRTDENSNIDNRPSVRANLFPSPRQSSLEMNRPIVLGLPAVQIDNASMVNIPSAQAIDFPIPRQSSLEMDNSIVVSSNTMGAISFLQDLAYSTPLFEEPFFDEEPVFNEEQNQEVNIGLTEEEIMTCIGYETFESVTEETLDNKEACSICKEEYVNGEEIGRLDCAHKFHIDCIKQWLGEKNTCPICRRMGLMPIDELADHDDCDIDDDL